MKSTALTNLADEIDQGMRKAQVWIESQTPVLVDFSDRAEAFVNINSPDEYAAFQSGKEE